jgi:hypothetical protein
MDRPMIDQSYDPLFNIRLFTPKLEKGKWSLEGSAEYQPNQHGWICIETLAIGAQQNKVVVVQLQQRVSKISK